MTEIASQPGVNWWMVIVTLEKHGYTHAAMGAAIGVSRAGVESWKNRYIEPSHESGERLCALWRAVTGQQPAELPRKTTGTLSAANLR